MTGFERKGCEFQLDSQTVPQAVKNFEYSCEVCCNRGIRISCDRCAIAATHVSVVAFILDEEEEKWRREVERIKSRKGFAQVNLG